MNRQRRLDAIARRRAFIDSQIQMLSNPETRVPNIIRSRRGITQPPKPIMSNIQGEQVVQIQAPSPSKVKKGNAVGQSTPVPSSSSSVIGETESTEEIYVTVLQDNDDEGHATFRIEGTAKHGQNDGHFPITLSDDIVKMFSGATDQLPPFQTIQTDDGTVMVVLEGSNFTETEPEASNTASVGETESSEISVSHVSVPDTPVESTNEEITTTEYYEESYVIVQTADGEMLVPSSNLSSEFQTQTVSAEENVVQFMTTESGAIEHLIADSNSSSGIANRTKSMMSTKMQQNVTVHNKVGAQKISVSGNSGNDSASKKPVVNVKGINTVNKLIKRPPPPKPKVPIKKINASTKNVHKLTRDTLSNNRVVAGSVMPPKISFRENEKPRPFRFELPELEDEDHLNDLDDCFMSVPVPITIGSLRSETEKSKINSMERSEMSLSHFSVAATSGESICSGLEDGCKDEDTGVQEEMSRENQPCQDKHLSEEIQNPGFSSDDKLPSPADNDNCNTCLFQCGRCFQIFNTESSITDHMDNCENPKLDSDVTSFCKQVKEEPELPPCINTQVDYLDSVIRNEDPYDTAEEKLIIIKSVNSLKAPVESPFVEPEQTQLEISSPVKKSEDHVNTNMCTLDQGADSLPAVKSILENDDIVSYCVQLVDDSELSDKSQPSCKKAKVDVNSAGSFLDPSNEVIIQIKKQEEVSATVQESICLNSLDVSRRTLDKASAKMNVVDEMSVEEGWDNMLLKETATDHIDGNGNKVTIQSARIRSRNDRLKAMDENVTSEEQIGVDFLNIFEQVVKQNV